MNTNLWVHQRSLVAACRSQTVWNTEALESSHEQTQSRTWHKMIIITETANQITFKKSLHVLYRPSFSGNAMSLRVLTLVLFQVSILDKTKVSKCLEVHKYLMLFCLTYTVLLALTTKTSTYRLYLAPHELLQFFHQLYSLIHVTVFPAAKNNHNVVTYKWCHYTRVKM